MEEHFLIHRISEMIKYLQSRNKVVTVQNIIKFSLFSNGGTLAGYAPQIQKILDVSSQYNQ